MGWKNPRILTIDPNFLTHPNWSLLVHPRKLKVWNLKKGHLDKGNSSTNHESFPNFQFCSSLPNFPKNPSPRCWREAPKRSTPWVRGSTAVVDRNPQPTVGSTVVSSVILFCVWGMFYTPQNFNIEHENDGFKRTLLFQRLIFRFHVKLQGVWFCPKPQQSLKNEGFHHTTFHDSKMLAILQTCPIWVVKTSFLGINKVTAWRTLMMVLQESCFFLSWHGKLSII